MTFSTGPTCPAPPSDEYIYSVKKRAFELGLDICGTGVRNDFCNPDPAVREQDKVLIKNWILVAEKLDAPALRIFQGEDISKDHFLRLDKVQVIPLPRTDVKARNRFHLMDLDILLILQCFQHSHQ